MWKGEKGIFVAVTIAVGNERKKLESKIEQNREKRLEWEREKRKGTMENEMRVRGREKERERESADGTPAQKYLSYHQVEPSAARPLRRPAPFVTSLLSSFLFFVSIPENTQQSPQQRGELSTERPLMRKHWLLQPWTRYYIFCYLFLMCCVVCDIIDFYQHFFFFWLFVDRSSSIVLHQD